MRLALAGLLIALLPATVSACRAPPHTYFEFRMSSFVNLTECTGQFEDGCANGGISAAWYENPTDRYTHGVLGDAIEGTRLSAYTASNPANSCGTIDVQLDDQHVFEDTKPRLADVDLDGHVEIITVRSHLNYGAQLAIYGQEGRELELIAATPYIGSRNRWLAPIGAADLDGDGHIEIAYIDRPHLAKTLRVWRFKDDALTEVTAASGLTNHRIGEDFISGGIRDCGQGPEMITADADWSNIMATRMVDGTLQARIIGRFDGSTSFEAALSC